MSLPLKFIHIPMAVLLSMAWLVARPPDLRFRQLTIDDGLSQSTVYDIEKDARGFMWFATEDGLNRYDGYEFKIFQHRPADSTSLPSATVLVLLTDRAGRLWVGTNSGLCRYNDSTESFQRFPIKNAPPGANDIRALYEDGHGNLWVGTYGGLYVLDIKRESYNTHLTEGLREKPVSGKPVLSITGDKEKQRLYIGYLGGLAVINMSPSVPMYKEVLAEDGGDGLPGTIIYALHMDDSGILWIGGNDGMSRYDPATKRFRRYKADPSVANKLSKPTVWKIIAAGREALWIANYGGGLFYFDKKKGRFKGYRNEANNPRSLSDNRLLALYADTSRPVPALWVGSVSGGVNAWFPEKQKFRHFAPLPGKPGLSNGIVYSFCEDARARLWVCTARGLELWDESGRRFIPYPDQTSEYYCITPAGREGLWVGRLDGLWRFNIRKGKLSRPFPQKEDFAPLRQAAVLHILREKETLVWLATRRGLVRYNPFGQTVRLYKHAPRDSSTLSANEVRRLMRDSRGRLWVATARGLNIFQEASNSFRRLPGFPQARRGLRGTIVYHVMESRDGQIWAATDAGLHRYRPDGGFDFWGEEQGLANHVLYGILEDDRGRLWLSTNRGLSRFDPQNETFTNFTVEDGLQANEFNAGAFFRRRNGHFLFGGINGFNSFDPAGVRLSRYVPPVALTGFRLFNRPAELPVSISVTKKIELRHDRNFFSFEFAGLDYSSPGKNQYRYHLKGFDAAVVESGNGRVATYTNVPPGEYTFEVWSSNSDGVWNPEPARLALSIPPPFWATWWFRGLILMAVVLILAGIRRYQLGRIREIINIRARIAADLHDEIASSLASVHLYSEVVEKQLPGATAETRNIIDRIRHLSREAMEGIAQIVWAVDPRHDSLDDMLKTIMGEAGQLFRAAGITFAGRQPENIPALKLSPDQRRATYLILKEAMNNIIRHAACKKVTMSVSLNGKELIFSLEDDGRGFETDRADAGHGLRNMKERARAARAAVEIASRPGQGTRLTLRVKIA